MADRGNTIPKKIGPWRREDYESFLALDVELRPTRQSTLTGLLSMLPLSTLSEQQRLVDEAWKARRSHPVYKALGRDTNFQAAWRVFEHRRRAATDGKLASPTAPFVFLHQFVQYAGLASIARSQRWATAQPPMKDGMRARGRQDAIKRANTLLGLLGRGVCLRDYADTQHLRVLLQRLSDELSNMKRKDYGGRQEAQRSILKGFALLMLLRCDLKSPTVVMRFADFAGLPCDEKKARRYCNEADQRCRDIFSQAVATVASRRARTRPP